MSTFGSAPMWSPRKQARMIHETHVAIEAGLGHSDAVRFALLNTSRRLARDVATGISLNDALIELGVRNADEVAEQILNLSDPAERRPAAFYLVADSGDVQGVPTPECIERHLPKNRRPTREELEAAWRACSA